MSPNRDFLMVKGLNGSSFYTAVHPFPAVHLFSFKVISFSVVRGGYFYIIIGCLGCLY